MKTIEYDNDIVIRCPTCDQILLDTTSKKPMIKECKHVLAWHNDGFCYVHKSLKKAANDFENKEGFEGEPFFKRLVKKDKNIVVHKYKTYLGGQIYGFDLIAFKK